MKSGKQLSSIIEPDIIGPDVILEGLTLDSRSVKPGFLFCAVKGEKTDGHQYIIDAINKGAVAVATEADMIVGADVSRVIDPQLKQNLGLIARAFYDYPCESLSVIAITGTNGKTSTSDYIRQLLDLLGSPCASVGTLGVRFQNNYSPLENTTPDVITLNRILRFLVDNNQRTVAMEVSSHALVQNRVAGLKFDTAIFTNITQDHLDYHGTISNYAAAKSQLFSHEDLRCGIINMDDAEASVMLSSMSKNSQIIRYSLINEEADVYLKNIKSLQPGYQAILCYQGEEFFLQTHLMGEFNLYNLLASIIAIKEQGFPLKNIMAKIILLQPVEGRMHVVENVLGVNALVDFAHTPDALENILSSIKPESGSKLHVVFGCGGDRDKGKRHLMGAIAEKYADYCWITSDNPRSESELDICQDIVQGMKKHDHAIILDRKRAIGAAVEESSPGDYLIVAGKGHEKYQQINDEYLPFDDVVVLSQALNQSRNGL